jgi:hypothetical protein
MNAPQITSIGENDRLREGNWLRPPSTDTRIISVSKVVSREGERKVQRVCEAEVGVEAWLDVLSAITRGRSLCLLPQVG